MRDDVDEMLDEFDRHRDRMKRSLRNIAAAIRHEMDGLTPEGKAWLLYDTMMMCADRLIAECNEDARDWAVQWTTDVVAYLRRWEAWNTANNTQTRPVTEQQDD
ncbi:MAG: hypothetical protein KatS3mg023_1808 [Armatimonadota bacterium]|nr:MAG: hypothetical protein KatS3mg023_1808 [Armatimonadota bacterium]